MTGERPFLIACAGILALAVIFDMFRLVRRWWSS